MAGEGAVAAAAIVRAVKTSGTIVKVEPAEFRSILDRQQEPLVVVARVRFISHHYRYLTSYKGLAFYTQSPDEIELPGRSEIIEAGRIWVP